MFHQLQLLPKFGVVELHLYKQFDRFAAGAAGALRR
jgi:hypothetical protein